MKIRNKNTGAEYNSETLTYQKGYFFDGGNKVVDDYGDWIPLNFDSAYGWTEVKEESSSIDEAAKAYSFANNERPDKEFDKEETLTYGLEKGFKAGAIWMCNKYFKDSGLDKIFEECLKEKENIK